MESSQVWSTTFTLKCGWWTRRKILVKRYTLCAFRTGFNEVVFTMRGDDSKRGIYQLLLQNGAKEIHMTSGMFIL
ncbi:MAG: hypothetical protein WAK17_03670 [Candidatus Nitrosopolaris sp.]